MIPILYDAFETDFGTNGIGLLVDSISCIVTEERNGAYELQLTYPVQGQHASYIEEDCIIKAKANDDDKPQLFRIYRSGKTVRGNTTWYAEHISYELNANPIEKFSISGVDAQRAMNTLFEGAAIPHKFKAHSDILTTNSTSIEEVLSVRSILGGVEGSLLDVWGGEYHFDNYDVYLLKNRGSDNGVVIEYGKNLIDANQEKNISNVVTAILPFANYSTTTNEVSEQVFVTLPERVLIHEDSKKYATVRCVPVNFSDQFDTQEEITVDALRTKAKQYLNSGITEPSINITLSFQSLQKTKDYKNLAALETVKLCDIVTVRIAKLDIDAKAKVVKTQYNTLKERYDSIEVGEVKTNLAKEIAANSKATQTEIAKTNTRAEEIKATIEQTILDVTNAITGNSGGYVVLYPPKNPVEIFIMDQPDTATAKNVWRWNLSGLGFSKKGVGGPYETAITADGKIVANFIAAGELNGNLIKAGTVYAGAIDVEYRNSINNNFTSLRNTTDSISLEVGKKVGKTEVITSINASLEGVAIKGTKISLMGNVTANNNVKFTTNGAIEANSGWISILRIHDYGLLFYNPAKTTYKSQLTYQDSTGDYRLSIDGIWLRGLMSIPGGSEIYGSGNITCGDLKTLGTKNRVVETKNYGNVAMNAFESPAASFFDNGSCTIGNDGKCFVFLNPLFRETIDEHYKYEVQLTRTSEKKVEWVEKKDEYFIIHGETGATADWMVIARQKGYANDYMEAVSIDRAEMDTNAIKNSIDNVDLEQREQTEISEAYSEELELDYTLLAKEYLEEYEREVMLDD